MPSVAQESPTLQSSKKRRRDDSSHAFPLAHSVNNDTPRSILSGKALNHVDLLQHHHSLHLAGRKIIPMPPGKRQRTWADVDISDEADPMQRSPSSSPSTRAQHEHEGQDRRHDHSKDATRAASHEHARIRPTATTTQPTSSSVGLMSRCHICSRKPNKKADLDSFADCQGCGQRTCYVCIRECLGWGAGIKSDFRLSTTTPTTTAAEAADPTEPGEADTSFSMIDADAVEDQPPPPPEQGHTETQGHGWTRGGGHRQVVCSRCCVERGQDGDVVCLGCLPFVES